MAVFRLIGEKSLGLYWQCSGHERLGVDRRE